MLPAQTHTSFRKVYRYKNLYDIFSIEKRKPIDRIYENNLNKAISIIAPQLNQMF